VSIADHGSIRLPRRSILAIDTSGVQFATVIRCGQGELAPLDLSMRRYSNCSTALGELLARYVVCSVAEKPSLWLWLSTDCARKGVSKKMMGIF